MSHLSGVCSNCGKKEEEHFGPKHQFCTNPYRLQLLFYDSGQKVLDEHSAELFEAVSVYVEAKSEEKENRGNTNGRLIGVKIKDAYQKLESILNKIKPSK